MVAKSEPYSCILTITGFEDSITSLSFSPDGRHLAMGSYDGTMAIFVVPGGRVLSKIRLPEPVTSILYLPTNRNCVLVGCLDGNLVSVQAETDEHVSPHLSGSTESTDFIEVG